MCSYNILVNKIKKAPLERRAIYSVILNFYFNLRPIFKDENESVCRDRCPVFHGWLNFPISGWIFQWVRMEWNLLRCKRWNHNKLWWNRVLPDEIKSTIRLGGLKNPTNLPNQRFGVGTRNLGVRSTLRCSAASLAISYSWINRFQRWYSRIFHPP